MSSLTLTAGDYRAEISALGGGVRAFYHRDQPLVTEYPVGGAPIHSGGIWLAPWPNRTADGRYIHRGELYHLDLTEPERDNAIHGFVGNQAWESEHNGTSLTLTLSDTPHNGYPWPLDHSVTWRLDAEDGLSATYTVINRAEDPAPFGLGFHPYLRAGTEALDNCELRLDVDAVLPLDPGRNLPAGPLSTPAEAGVPDFHSSAPMRDVWLDHAVRIGAAGFDAELRPTNGGTGVRLRADGSFTWAQIYTDPDSPGIGRVVAVEPMTCPPDALRSGTDLIILEPGERRDFHLTLSILSL
ncbi:aldose epimerase family protein [Corynebacterium uterequi]|uniref:Galactose mutarotase-like enzyme n=1 Tax=Corynebacterium uterequi TaxID=1072256 RepID=A0A0G3HDT8_9CORY|nr:hypothetical protein [Corynebacterium uterequi]AKK11479.1 galactose mutarotase-like enzyme [Corynebacterium uterequi]